MLNTGSFFMIDTIAERVFPLDQIPPEMIPGRDGKPVRNVTRGLWHRRGVRGVRLETVMWGGGRCTSLEALARFYEAVSQAKALGNRRPQAIATRTRRQRDRAVREAIDVCRKRGA